MQTGLSENFWYDSKKEGLYVFKDVGIDHPIRNQYAYLYISLYACWKVFIRKVTCRRDFSGISPVRNISGISFVLHDHFAVYKVDRQMVAESERNRYLFLTGIDYRSYLRMLSLCKRLIID